MYPLQIALPFFRWIYGWVRTITDLVSVFSIPFYEVFQGYHDGDYNRTIVYYDGFPLPRLMNEKVVDRVVNFPVRESDVFIVGFPKSGTTWLQIVLSILHDWGTCNQNSHDRVPILEMPKVPGLEGYRQCLDAPSPRLIKSHLPYRFFPKNRREKGCKVIYISRNPKDVCVSFFHMLKGYGVLQEESAWRVFQERFIAGDVIYGSWLNHVTSWWETRDENVLYITYEDMKRDTRGVLKKIILFLKLQVPEEKFEEVLERSSFDHMRKLGRDKLAIPKWFYNQKSAPFFRKGIVGDWRNRLTKEESEAFDREIGTKVKDRNLEFLYDW